MTRLTLFLALCLSANAATQYGLLNSPPWIEPLSGSLFSQAASTIYPTEFTNSNAKLTLGTNGLTSSAFLKIENRLDGDEGNSPFAIFTRDGIELSRIDTNGVFQMAGTAAATTGGPSWTNYVWLAPDGNDATAVRNRPDLPCRTWTNAVAIAQAGDLIRANGIFTNYAVTTFPHNVSALADGLVVVYHSLTLLNDGCPFVPGDNGVYDGIKVIPLNMETVTAPDGQASFGIRNVADVQQQIATNWIVRGLYGIGDTDVIYVNDTNMAVTITYTIENSSLKAAYDAVANLSTNIDCTIRGSFLEVEGPSFANPIAPARAVNNYGRVTVVNSVIKVSGSSVMNLGVLNNSATATASICGTLFDVSGTAATNYTISGTTVCAEVTESSGLYWPQSNPVIGPYGRGTGALWDNGTGVLGYRGFQATNQLWVDLLGSDDNDGSQGAPLRTIPYAVSLADGVGNWVVNIGANLHSNNVPIILTNNTTLRGRGPDRTIIGSTNGTAIGNVVSVSGTNVWIEDLTISGLEQDPTNDFVRVLLGDAVDIPISGGCRNVWFDGQTDNVVINSSATNSFAWYDCKFKAKNDMVLFLGTDGHSKYYFNQCEWRGSGPPNTNAPFNTSAIRIGGVQVFLSGCVISVTNNSPTNSGASALTTIYDSSARMVIDNSTVDTSSPTNSWDIDATAGGTWLVRNSAVNQRKIKGLVSFEDTTWRVYATGSGAILSPHPTNRTFAVQLALSNNTPTFSLQRPTGGGWQFSANTSDAFSFNEVAPSGLTSGRLSIQTNGTVQVVDRNNSSSGISLQLFANTGNGSLKLWWADNSAGNTYQAGGVTASNLTASTVLQADANQKITSIANGTGMLTNNGSGGVGYAAIPPRAVTNITTTYITATGVSLYTTPANVFLIKVEGWGGGGGGGAVDGATSQAAAGGGGGSGAYFETNIFSPAASYVVTVGTNGPGGAATSANGSAGGQTLFTNLCTAPGGLGGIGQASSTADKVALGGAGAATATGGEVNTGGNPGSPGMTWLGVLALSGNGASGFRGQGAGAGQTAAVGGAATGYGAGGGGAAVITNTDRAGGAGSQGVIIITEYYK